MHYISTRGEAPKLGFKDVVLAGLAEDGGLYVPEFFPEFSSAEIASFASLSYPELMLRVISPYIGSEIDSGTLKNMIEDSYRDFRHPAIAPLVQTNVNEWVLELFHGETLAFKDFALQFLGRMLDYLLKEQGKTANIIGATSGDTGSAAIAGCKGSENINIFILHPEGKVSDVQRKMMTTVANKNVFNLALKGNFDDCQDIVKAIFGDIEFKKKYSLTAINSINWVRVLAQVVYYFYAAVRIGAPFKKISFSVPTGNFGDIYAGFIAYKMGLPIDKLIIATNKNDILDRFIKTGKYESRDVASTISPSIDIQVASNFERLLFNAHGNDGDKIKQMMNEFKATKSLSVEPSVLNEIRKIFASESCSEENTKNTIKSVYNESGYLIDTHTAVGVYAARSMKTESCVVVLATAHPAKFPDAVKDSCGVMPQLPSNHSRLFEMPERLVQIENSVDAVKRYLEEKAL